MAVNLEGIFHLVLMGLTEHVFGNIVITSTMIMLVLVVLALLIQIPVPFAVAIPIPLAIVLTAYGYLTVATGGILTAVFLVLAIASFLAGLGISR
jgi:hypothetical protein